jgi:hypothetical protein
MRPQDLSILPSNKGVRETPTVIKAGEPSVSTRRKKVDQFQRPLPFSASMFLNPVPYGLFNEGNRPRLVFKGKRVPIFPCRPQHSAPRERPKVLALGEASGES